MSSSQSADEDHSSVPSRFDHSAFSADAIGFVFGPVMLLGWLLLVPQGELSPEAHRLMGVLWLTIVWWMTEPIPIAATGLLAVVLCVVLGAVPADAHGKSQVARTVLAPFADPSLFFLLGGLFIGRAMTKHGLDRRIALAILCRPWASRTPATLLFAVGLAVALVSMWISNTAATAMVYPVTLGIIAVLAEGSKHQGTDFARSPYASVLLLMTAYSSGVGGVATPIGTGTNLVARGLFNRPEYLGQAVDFLSWMLVGVPLMALLFVGLYLWLKSRAPSAGIDLALLRDHLHDEYARLGPWKRGELNTLVVFLLVVALWVAPGVFGLLASRPTQQAFRNHFPEEIVALLAPVLLFLLPTDWQQRRFSLEGADFAQIDWGTVLLFGSGMALGTLMVESGLARAIGQAGFTWLDTRDLWTITALAIASAILLSEFTSNAATATALIPVFWGICQQADVEPIIPLMGVTFGASFGSALPVSTPPNAIVYGSGLIPVRRMVVAGLGFDVVSALTIWIVLRVAWEFGWTPMGR